MVNYAIHPLDCAHERVVRAGEHLGCLEIEIARVFERQANGVTFQLDPIPPHYAINVRPPQETFFGMRIGILVGEICYNLRSALDYLIFELANLDSGAPQDGTQFPITDAKKKFDGYGRTTHLKGVNDTHVAAIEDLQPYNGCQWTKQLQGISNPDKHRHFAVSGGQTRITVHSGLASDLTLIRGMAFTRHASHPLTSVKVDVKVHIAGSVMFDDGSPILETLQEIKCGVAGCLSYFRPEF